MMEHQQRSLDIALRLGLAVLLVIIKGGVEVHGLATAVCQIA
jgi:hypothetical protein